MTYKLLTPGPLSTTKRVRKAMFIDRCTWDDDYKLLTQTIRRKLLTLAQVDETEFTTVLMQGSGSFVVESVLMSTVKASDCLLIVTNGAYGKRIVQMADVIGLSYVELSLPFNQVPTVDQVEDCLKQNKEITHVAIVHCETTTGLLNPVKQIGQVVKQYSKTYIVDAMSSFGGIPLSIKEAHIDYLISSANKCIHGVPGFGFVIANRAHFETTEGISRSLSLDLFDQWKQMERDGKWRFTSPTHVVAAFEEALRELEDYGGIKQRYIHYQQLNRYLIAKMKQIGFSPYVKAQYQSPIITTFYFPNSKFDFTHFYNKMKEKGFILYPGKLTDDDTFRIGNIGDISMEDMKKLINEIKQYMEEYNYEEDNCNF